jgi:3-dehydroquinate synthase class II
MQGIMEVTVTVDNPIVDRINDFGSVQIVNLRTDSFGEATIQLVLTPGANGDGVVDFVTALLEKSNVNHFSYAAKPGVEWTPNWEAIYPAGASMPYEDEDDFDDYPTDDYF